MREILADLVAEQQALDQLLQRAPERDWRVATPAKGWTVQDTISHLAASEDHAFAALEGAAEVFAEAGATHYLEIARINLAPARALREELSG